MTITKQFEQFTPEEIIEVCNFINDYYDSVCKKKESFIKKSKMMEGIIDLLTNMEDEDGVSVKQFSEEGESSTFSSGKEIREERKKVIEEYNSEITKWKTISEKLNHLKEIVS